MKNIAFIINPKSGTQNKRKLPRMIREMLDHEQWLENIVYSERAGHVEELARQFARMGFDAVVAVGGDGTVNEVARGLRDTQTALGVIPMGSGNGFARHLNIPVRTNRAIEMLNHSEPIMVDYGLANGKLFVSTCGTGFDALIAEQFAGSTKRGFMTYLHNVLQDVLRYRAESYHLKGEGIDVVQKAFFMTFANASQWGSEAYIAPKASIQDGMMDICIMSKNMLMGAPGLALRLFTKSIDDSLFVDTLRTREIWVERESASAFHIDGDPVDMPKDIHVKIVPDGLRVLVEKRF